MRQIALNMRWLADVYRSGLEGDLIKVQPQEVDGHSVHLTNLG